MKKSWNSNSKTISMNAAVLRSVEVKLELEGSPAERVPAGEVELLAAVTEGMTAALLGLRV